MTLPTEPSTEILLQRLRATAPAAVRRTTRWAATWHGWRDGLRELPLELAPLSYPGRVAADAQAGQHAVETCLQELLTEVDLVVAALPPLVAAEEPDSPGRDLIVTEPSASEHAALRAARKAAAQRAADRELAERARRSHARMEQLSRHLRETAEAVKDEHDARAQCLVAVYHHHLLRRHPRRADVPSQTALLQAAS